MTFRDWLWNLIQNNPVGVTSFVRVAVGGASAFGLEVTASQLAYIMTVLEGLLGLITYKVTTPNAHVEDKVDQKVAYREAVTKSGTSGI